MIDRQIESRWLELTLNGLAYSGYMVIENVLAPSFVSTIRDHLYRAQSQIVASVGQDRLERAGELGVLRLLMRFEPFFMQLLEIPEVLEIVDATVSNTAILHLQNGFILPSLDKDRRKEWFQTTFHRDFPRLLNGYLASINIFIALDDFTSENGATLVVPGTHQRPETPSPDYIKKNEISVICPAGSLIVFDSTLIHASGFNTSGKDRLAINQQFTRSFIKQQIDYVRALGPELIGVQKPRTQQLLGHYTRVVTSLDEFYQPEGDRLYRRGQG